MKNRIKKIILNILFYIGLFLGSVFSYLNEKNKLMIIKLICNFSSSLSKRYYFVFYQFLFGFMTNIVSRTCKPLIVSKTLKTKSLMSLDLLEKTQRNIYISKLYEMGISNFFLKNIKKGDIFFDIGANVGYFSILLANIVGDKGKIYSFEPEINNFSKLKKNIKINNFLNIVFVNKAIGVRKDKLILNLNPLNHGGHSLNPFSSYKFGHKIYTKGEIESSFKNKELHQEVEVVSVDDFILENKVEFIDMMKIDIEGYEFEALKGMRKSLKDNNIKILFVK